MKKIKPLEELTLLNRFLFDEVMERQENMEALLEIILGKDVQLKHLPQSEKEQRTSSDLRSVRQAQPGDHHFHCTV